MMTAAQYYRIYRGMNYIDPYTATFSQDERRRLNMPDSISDYDLARYLVLSAEAFRFESDGREVPEHILDAKFEIIRLATLEPGDE